MMLRHGFLPLGNFVTMVRGLSRREWGQLGGGGLSAQRERQKGLTGSIACTHAKSSSAFFGK